MEVPKNVQHQIAQFQQMQQQAQAITMQKQSVEMQIRETDKALEELKKWKKIQMSTKQRVIFL